VLSRGLANELFSNDQEKLEQHGLTDIMKNCEDTLSSNVMSEENTELKQTEPIKEKQYHAKSSRSQQNRIRIKKTLNNIKIEKKSEDKLFSNVMHEENTDLKLDQAVFSSCMTLLNNLSSLFFSIFILLSVFLILIRFCCDLEDFA
jgi:hypothetical protein